MPEADQEALNASLGEATRSFLLRLLMGGIGWAAVTAVLVGIALLTAIPFGVGSSFPIVLVLPWTLLVAYWIVKPLAAARPLSAVPRIVLAVALCAVAAAAWYWTEGSDRRQFMRKLAPHHDHFTKACRQAGTRVQRRVDGVDSIVFEGVRASTTQGDLADPAFRGDVYSQFDTAHNPRESLARAFVTRIEWEERWHVPRPDEFLRYPQVEIRGEQEGKPGYFRYTDATQGSHARLNTAFVDSPASQYVVRIEDITTAEDRRHWVAGTRWTVVHQPTGEVLGESVAYAIDTLQGQTKFPGGFGNAGEPWAPWLRAGHVQYDSYKVGNACPPKDISQQRIHNLDFLRSVLVPVHQEMKLIPR